jgi:hypothetical protein
LDYDFVMLNVELLVIIFLKRLLW